MSANVALSETFDQWRVKTNELLVMTQTDGSSNFVKLNNLTDSVSNTTGSFITTGGVGIGKSVRIGENLNVHGNIHANGTITANGNITLGDSSADTVVFSADIDSNFIPDDDVTYNLGSSTQRWANLYAESTRLVQDTDAGQPAIYIDANDVDQQVVIVDAEQTTVNVFQIDADALTTGAAVVISENSASALDRKTLSIVQANTAAVNAIALSISSNGGHKGIFVDKNYTSTATATGSASVKGADIDLDQVSASGNQIDVFGIDINSTATGGAGTGTNIGIRSTVAGSATSKYAGIFTGGNTGFGTSTPIGMVDIVSASAQLRLYDGSAGGVTFTTAGTTTTLTGNLTVAGTIRGTINSGSDPVSGAAGTFTGALTTTDNIGANTASITSGAALDVKGAIAFSQEMAAPSSVADTAFIFANTDGSLIYMTQAGNQTNISAAASGASTTEENTFTAQQYFDDQALTSGTAVSWNANTAQVATLTLGHNATMSNATNHKSGGVYILRVTQSSSPKTLAWGTSYKWPGNTAPVMTATASAVDVFTFVSDGTYMYGSFSGSQNFT